MTTMIKRLIVTRPESQAAELIEQLKNHLEPDTQVQLCSLLTIKPIPIELYSTHQNFNAYDGIIFISRHSADYFYAALNQQQKEQLTQVKHFAVGEQSADFLQKISHQPVIYPQQMNAEGLLALPQLKAVSNQHWLIIKGEGGRQLIQQTLNAAGAVVDELDVYQRCLPNLPQQKVIQSCNSQQTLWLITSAEALNNLHRIQGLASKPQHKINVMVTSQRLAELANNKGFVILEEALGASTQQIVKSARHYFSSKVKI